MKKTKQKQKQRKKTKEKDFFMIRKTWNFCYQSLRVVATVDKKLKISALSKFLSVMIFRVKVFRKISTMNKKWYFNKMDQQKVKVKTLK